MFAYGKTILTSMQLQTKNSKRLWNGSSREGSYRNSNSSKQNMIEAKHVNKTTPNSHTKKRDQQHSPLVSPKKRKQGTIHSFFGNVQK
mmetsp:Transcript_36005/g.43373  ORF Transcript_36005/g.43373 Transcript_36005/m.43373 type:complete len:88 (-) Transcript_36005:137-400(-)